MNIQERVKEFNKDVEFRKVFLNYETLGIFELEEINNKIRNLKPDEPLIVSGYTLKKSSQRYVLFMRDEQVCVTCGAKASFWALQRTDKDTNPHLNLWGFDKEGKTILFTKDHIQPKSLGGKDKMENYQLMCDVCNGRKGNFSKPIAYPITKKSIKRKAGRGGYLEYIKEGNEVTKRNFKRFSDKKKTAIVLKVDMIHPITGKDACLLSNYDILECTRLVPSFIFLEN